MSDDSSVTGYFLSLPEETIDDPEAYNEPKVVMRLTGKISPMEYVLEGERETAQELLKLHEYIERQRAPSCCYKFFRSLVLFWWFMVVVISFGFWFYLQYDIKLEPQLTITRRYTPDITDENILSVSGYICIVASSLFLGIKNYF